MIRKVLSATVFFGAVLAATAAHAQTYEKLHSFAGAPADGATPYGAMIQTASGTFYGTTVAGGANDCGTVFTTDGSGAPPVILHSMTQAEGCGPMGALLLATDGFFYGTAFTGGDHSNGTVFKMNANGDVTVVHHFDDGALEGRSPMHAVIQATDGLIYGTTFEGGAAGSGTAFRINGDSSLTVLHTFGADPDDGKNPSSGLIQDANGTLTFYGTTFQGGNPNGPECDPCDRVAGGTVYEMTVSGNVGAVFNRFNFELGGFIGDTPNGGLIQTGPTTFYGTTSSLFSLMGGIQFETAGSIFELDTSPDWGGLYTHRVFEVAAPYDGLYLPLGTLARGADGQLYGTTLGIEGMGGGVFRWHIDGSEQLDVLHRFDGTADSSFAPVAPLVKGLDGNIYGSTQSGIIPYFASPNDPGTLFRIVMPAVKADQTISFAPLGNKYVGDADFSVSATASSGLTVTFTPSGSCTMTGSLVHLTGAGTCTITASQAGDASYNAAPDNPQSFSIATPTHTLSLAQTAVTGGTNVNGTVTLTSPAPNGGAVIALTSSLPGVASVPATITVPKGKTSKPFTITTSGVAAATAVVISTSYGSTTRFAGLTVNPSAVKDVTLTPKDLKGGQPTNVKVTLTGPAPTGGLLVTLASSNTAVVANSSVLVPAGATSASKSLATTKVNAATTVTITATGGGASDSAALNVRK